MLHKITQWAAFRKLQSHRVAAVLYEGLEAKSEVDVGRGSEALERETYIACEGASAFGSEQILEDIADKIASCQQGAREQPIPSAEMHREAVFKQITQNMAVLGPLKNGKESGGSWKEGLATDADVATVKEVALKTINSSDDGDPIGRRITTSFNALKQATRTPRTQVGFTRVL